MSIVACGDAPNGIRNLGIENPKNSGKIR
jgi:hypothetical protein